MLTNQISGRRWLKIERLDRLLQRTLPGWQQAAHTARRWFMQQEAPIEAAQPAVTFAFGGVWRKLNHEYLGHAASNSS